MHIDARGSPRGLERFGKPERTPLPSPRLRKRTEATALSPKVARSRLEIAREPARNTADALPDRRREAGAISARSVDRSASGPRPLCLRQPHRGTFHHCRVKVRGAAGERRAPMSRMVALLDRAESGRAADMANFHGLLDALLVLLRRPAGGRVALSSSRRSRRFRGRELLYAARRREIRAEPSGIVSGRAVASLARARGTRVRRATKRSDVTIRRAARAALPDESIRWRGGEYCELTAAEARRREYVTDARTTIRSLSRTVPRAGPVAPTRGSTVCGGSGELRVHQHHSAYARTHAVSDMPSREGAAIACSCGRRHPAFPRPKVPRIARRTDARGVGGG